MYTSVNGTNRAVRQNASGHPAASNISGIPQPALMASSSILTIGPYKHRKDLTKESVLLKYQIIGYIAAGTYGKVYKAKSKTSGSGGNVGSGAANGANGANGSTNTTPGGSWSPGGGNDKNTVAKDLSVHNMMHNRLSDPTNGDPQGVADVQLFAIKKFKSDNHLSNKSHNNHDINGNEIVHYTGISQSAIREMSLCRELNHKNITKLIDIILENKSIYMIFEFFEHDLLQIIHYHSHPEIKPIPDAIVKSLIWQVLNGVTFLHKNWIFHRDLKPANIMVSSAGVVKIGDLGLARKFNNPLQSLYTGDKVVVTIWYRAPELLLGTRHYTPAIDLWAVGCILAELLSLRPIFKGEEAKIDMNNKKLIPFQKNQLQKILEILGTPTQKTWPSLTKYPEYQLFQLTFLNNNITYPPNLVNWYKLIGGKNKNCLGLLKGLLEYDPVFRLTAENALVHPFFLELPKVNENAFSGMNVPYPKRRIYTDDNDIVSNVNNFNASNMQNMNNVKRNAYDDSNIRKRQR